MSTLLMGLILGQIKVILIGGYSSRHGDALAGLSYSERKALKRMVKTFPSGQKVLLAWPTIPVAFKGSDSRPIDAIKTLTSMGFDVDLMFWHDYSDEIVNDNYDDTQDRQRVIQAGVHRIMGPYNKHQKQRGGFGRQTGGAPPLPSSYSIFIYWLWPDGEFLTSLLELSAAVKRQNSQAGIIAAVDDRSIALRSLQGALINRERSVEDVEQLLLSMTPFQSRMDKTESRVPTEGWDMHRDFDPELLNNARYFLNAELRLYEEANVVLGINDATVTFLEKVRGSTRAFLYLHYIASAVSIGIHLSHIIEFPFALLLQLEPQLIVHRLSYVSTVQPPQGLLAGSVQSPPFAKRSGYLFFGYDNSANNNGLQWFINMVMPTLPLGETFHIAGTVKVPAEHCTSTPRTNTYTSLNPAKVICHGPIHDDELDNLIQSVKVSINPILETSGVSTKTCRSMALGTPVVATDHDGTFTNDMTNIGGALRCRDNPSHNFAPCFHESMRTLLKDEYEWRRVAHAGPSFIAQNYGMTTYVNDWISILGNLRKEERHRILIFDSNNDLSRAGTGSAWDISNTISQFKDFDVTLMGSVPPVPDEVKNDGTSLVQFLSVPESTLTDRERKTSLRTSLCKTNVFISLSWPPDMAGNENTVRTACSSLWKCQVVQILPWELQYIDDECMNKHLSSILNEAARESILRPCK
jgi:hypothetical protein